MIVFSLFIIEGLLLSGCTTKEVKLLDKRIAKPTIDMSKFPEGKKVSFKVHKGSFVVTIKKADYVKMKDTNQDIKDRYVSLRAWVLGNIDSGLIKTE